MTRISIVINTDLIVHPEGSSMIRKGGHVWKYYSEGPRKTLANGHSHIESSIQIYTTEVLEREIRGHHFVAYFKAALLLKVCQTSTSDIISTDSRRK